MNESNQIDRLSDKIDSAVERMYEYKIDTNTNINGLRLDIQNAITAFNNRLNTIDLKVEKVSWKQRLIVSAMALISGGAGAGIVEFLKKNI